MNDPEFDAPKESRLPLPGMAGIALYMLVLSAVVAFGVLSHNLPGLFLLMSLLFAAASIGLLRQYRWGWALALGAAFLMMCYHSWIFFHLYALPTIIQIGLNLVFFLYLVRPDVRKRLR